MLLCEKMGFEAWKKSISLNLIVFLLDKYCYNGIKRLDL